MKRDIAFLVFFLALFLLAAWMLTRHLDRPTVYISVDTGKCVRAYGPNGPMLCKDAMKGSYEKIFVDDSKSRLGRKNKNN